MNAAVKQIVLIGLFLMSASLVQGQSFPDDLYAMPVADELSGHKWSYRKGLDFDVAGFQNESGKGVRVYLGVDSSATKEHQNLEFVSAKVMGQLVKLYKQCQQGSKDCMYTTLVKSGVQSGGNDLWVQIWVMPENGDIATYLPWLSSLKFVDGQS